MLLPGWAWFLIGAFVGIMAAVFALGICRMASDPERDNGEYECQYTNEELNREGPRVE